MPITKEVQELLTQFGFKVVSDQDSNLLSLLGVILKTCKSPPKPLSLDDIYEAKKKETPEKEFTKAWVRRVLNQLVDLQLVKIVNETAYRKQYVSDVNIVMGGLEELKSRISNTTQEEITTLQEKLEKISEIQCGILAQELVKGLTGKSQMITSRIIRELEEFQRVLKYNIHDASKKGDVIRATLGWIKPFLKGDMKERTQKFFDVARRGVEVRYLVTGDIIRSFQPTQESSKEMTVSMLQIIYELQEQGAKFDVRLYLGPPNYTFISLNNESMLLVVSEIPLQATWTTRGFNPDLIDNAIDSFDKQWDEALSLFDLSLEDMSSMGGQQDGVIPTALRKIKSDDSDKS